MSRSAVEECPHCGSENTGELRKGGGDGEVVIETVACAFAGCGRDLCPQCARHECDGCGKIFCGEHAITYGRAIHCPGCFADHGEPECTCERTDVDRMDARHCEACNHTGEYSRELRRAYSLLAAVKVREMDLAARLSASIKQVRREVA